MKKINFLALVVLIGLLTTEAHAVVRTVSNNINTPGQYSTIWAAWNAAAGGDTIYVSPSPYTYDGMDINKANITLIGGGYNAVNNGTQENLSTKVNSFRFHGGEYSWNCVIEGFEIGTVNFCCLYSSNSNSNEKLRRNHILNLVIGGYGWEVENNIIDAMSIGAGNLTGLAFRNNIVTGNISGAAMGTNCNFYHNIFEGTVNNMSFCTFTDNIFYFSHPTSWANTINCVFHNNIVYESSSYLALAYFNQNGNQGENNLNNDPGSPLFNSPEPPAAAQVYPALLNYNWSVAAGSQASWLGSDGTHCGIYGGYFPWPNFTGAPPIPQMTYLNIPVNSVGLNQPLLNVRFKARKQN